MKKLVLLFACLLLINLVSAVEITLSKEVYAPGETLQAEIYGNFIDQIELENIYFYRERNIPMIYDIMKAQNKYLLYALLPKKEGNYTLKIKDVRYETNEGVSTSDITKQFQIKSTNETVLTINPGFVIATEDFYIKVEANKNTDIDAEFLEEKQTLSLIQNKEERIYFSISKIENYTEENIKIKDYNIPVLIFPKRLQVLVIKETSKFRFNPLKIDAAILKKEDYFFKVALINLGRKNISDIEFSSNGLDDLNIKIVPGPLSILEAGEREFVNITLSSKKEKSFSGSIFAKSENFSAELKINIEVTKNESKVGYQGPAYTEDKNCAELGGKICRAKEKCSIPLELVIDGYCCRGECLVEEKSRTWIYGVVVLVVLVVGLVLLSIYTKKKKKPVDALKQREKKYEERMTGEVRGKLTRT